MFKVHCPDCGSTVTKETESAAEDTVDSHNDKRHDGQDVASVVGEQDPLDGFLDLLDDPHKTSSLFYAHRNNGQYRVLCRDCEGLEVCTETDEAWELVDEHNEFAHDGDAVAGVLEEDINETTDRRLPIDGPDAVQLVADISSDKAIITPDDR